MCKDDDCTDEMNTKRKRGFTMELVSNTWEKAGEMLRKSRLSTLTPGKEDEACWGEAFDLTIQSIKEERESTPGFAPELSQLDAYTGGKYDLLACLEAYFNHLESEEKWEEVISSCDKLFDLFAWTQNMPSEIFFRKGNALEALKRYDEAEAFGKEWLEKYPEDLYAAASNVYLKVALEKYDEAQAITEKYLGDDLICDENTDTFFMAAYRLYELTNDINAKQRVEKKMADYNKMIAERQN